MCQFFNTGVKTASAYMERIFHKQTNPTTIVSDLIHFLHKPTGFASFC